MPEIFGKRGLVGIPGEDRLIVRVVEEFLDKLTDGMAGLFAQVFGDLGLLEAGLIDKVRQGFDAGRRSERDEQPHGIRQVAAAFPVRIKDDGNLRIHPGRVGND